MTMAENIRYLRIKRGLTQEQLGEVLGVQKSAIRKYESGTVENIPRASIIKMSELFGVSPAYLMGWENETPTPELTEGERAWLELYRALSPEVSELFFPVLQEFDNLPDGERQMLQAIIGTAIKNKK